MMDTVATLDLMEVRSRFQRVGGMDVLYAPFEQGTPEWHVARAGVTTASTYRIAREYVGGLDERQAAYVKAVKDDGMSEKEAMEVAGYKSKPSSQIIKDALAGKDTRVPSSAQLKLANTTAMERITGKPHGDTYETFAMKRGRVEEAWARRAYESRFDVEVGEAGLIVTPDFLFGYSTDGLVMQEWQMDGGLSLHKVEGLIEIKTLQDLQKLREYIELCDTQEFIDQCHGGLWITGAKWIDLVFWIPELQVLGNGNELWVKRIWRDENAIERLEADLLAFERRVQEAEQFWRTPWKNSDAPLPAYLKLPAEHASDMALNIAAGNLQATEKEAASACQTNDSETNVIENSDQQAQEATKIEEHGFRLTPPDADAQAGKPEPKNRKREKVAEGVASAAAQVAQALGEQAAKPVLGSAVQDVLSWDF